MKSLFENFGWSDLPKIVAAVTSAGCVHVFAVGYFFGPGVSAILDATYFSSLLFEASVDLSLAAMIVYGMEALFVTFGMAISKIGFSLGRNREIELPSFFRPMTSVALVIPMLFWFYLLYVGVLPFYLIGLMLVGWVMGAVPYRRFMLSMAFWRGNKRKALASIREDVFASSFEEHRQRTLGLLLAFSILFFPLYIGKQKVDVIFESQPNARIYLSGEEVDVFVVGRTENFLLYTTLERGLVAVPFSEFSFLKFDKGAKDEQKTTLQ